LPIVKRGIVNSRVLVVEDDPAIRRMVSSVLEEQGYEALTAEDAETAMELVSKHRPSAIISDVRLGGMDGATLSRRIKSTPEFSNTSVLLISAYPEPDGHAGDAFLAKPFDVNALIEWVKASLERRRG